MLENATYILIIPFVSIVTAGSHLKKALRHYFLWNLREAMLEVLQYVIVQLRPSLCHPEPKERVTESAARSAAPALLSSPDNTHE